MSDMSPKVHLFSYLHLPISHWFMAYTDFLRKEKERKKKAERKKKHQMAHSSWSLLPNHKFLSLKIQIMLESSVPASERLEVSCIYWAIHKDFLLTSREQVVYTWIQLWLTSIDNFQAWADTGTLLTPSSSPSRAITLRPCCPSRWGAQLGCCGWSRGQHTFRDKGYYCQLLTNFN